ncbi:MAG: metal-binding protein [Deinococcus sp.]|uniref:metal-binding protein n=1 Tax=Deinococcus sp. TaxID=47478 RepID=UPI0026DCE0C9|nr:metal-binding protein [Deinococcus sp.]MDO4245282.1 metal-binding protein [Deinococcus sp.]
MCAVPSGRVHNLINLAAFAVLGGAALILERQRLWPDPTFSLTPAMMLNFTWAFMAGTFLLSPDLDLSEGRVDSKRRWGPLGFLWVPYGKMFSHRGLSHTWLVGPLTRLIYLALIAALVWTVVKYAWPQLGLGWPRLPQPFPYKVALPIAAGYYVSQWLHLVADGISPDHGLRHARRKVRRRR